MKDFIISDFICIAILIIAIIYSIVINPFMQWVKLYMKIGYSRKDSIRLVLKDLFGKNYEEKDI